MKFVKIAQIRTLPYKSGFGFKFIPKSVYQLIRTYPNQSGKSFQSRLIDAKRLKINPRFLTRTKIQSDSIPANRGLLMRMNPNDLN